jgi:diguanylate cyclase (GGDEF)-like protein/PAS domain S-box-containing protein
MNDENDMSDKNADPDADSAFYKTLLESTKAIPWKIDWATLKFAYIGPQIEKMLGWQRSSWVSVQDWAERIHADEREATVGFCVEQSKSGIDHQADYRAQKSNGEYVWIRDVVHVMRREDGSVEALVGFMFDIDEQKKTEEKLAALQRELEALSFKDGLTGAANRRMFDTVLEREWADAQRNSKPLSLLMIDIDHFKQYNDCYGHVQGDECLKRVARALNAAAARPRDLLARYGGEEFAIVLPETDSEAARLVAQRCHALIAAEAIAHEKSPVAPLLTISIGIGTISPSPLDDPTRFIAQADARLYQAKQQGRNCLAY